MKKLICKLFGCQEVTEIYAVISKNNRYIIKEDAICIRCGKTHTKYHATGLSRAELLQHEWFIVESNKY